MQKIRKILRAVSEETVLPTNQPTNQSPTTPILQDLADAGPIKVFYTYFHTCCNTLLLILYIQTLVHTRLRNQYSYCQKFHDPLTHGTPHLLLR